MAKLLITLSLTRSYGSKGYDIDGSFYVRITFMQVSCRCYLGYPAGWTTSYQIVLSRTSN